MSMESVIFGVEFECTERRAPSVTGIIPRLDFAQAAKLLRKGKSPRDVIAAAERLGNHELKKQIELYVACGCRPACEFVFRRELGQSYSHRGSVRRGVRLE